MDVIEELKFLGKLTLTKGHIYRKFLQSIKKTKDVHGFY